MRVWDRHTQRAWGEHHHRQRCSQQGQERPTQLGQLPLKAQWGQAYQATAGPLQGTGTPSQEDHVEGSLRGPICSSLRENIWPSVLGSRHSAPSWGHGHQEHLMGKLMSGPGCQTRAAHTHQG